MDQKEKNKAWIEAAIKEVVDDPSLNNLRNEAGDRAWGEPLIGFSNGGDPLYDEFKNHIGDFYLKPLELFALTFPETEVSADELTVISWILPHTEKIKLDNRKEIRLPSEGWIRARIFGEDVNGRLRQNLVSTLQEAGRQALAPDLSPFKKSGNSPRYGRASSWSERHAAFASGLGTFGLCDGLITPVGKAVRIGSVIARIEIAPTERPYQDHHAYCLFYARGICLKCVERCPAEAISAAGGHDKKKCDTYIKAETVDYIKSRFGVEGHACGLCQTGVPCESRIPLKP